MKILFFPEWYPTSKTPYAGSFNLELVKSIRIIAAVDVMTIHFVRNVRFNNILMHTINAQHNEYEFFTGRSPLPGTTRFFIKGLYTKALKHYFKLNGIPDIIHTQDSTAYYVIKAIKSIGIPIPIVVSQHWTVFMHDSVNKLTLRRFSYIFQHSKLVLPAFKEASILYKKFNLAAPIKWLPNSLDTDIFAWKNRARKKWITHISGFTAQKRVEDIIYSFSEILKRHQDFTLHLIGEGIKRGYYESLAEQVLPKDSYFFYGFLNKQEICDHLNVSSCFVFPSTYETFGCVLMEAAACRCPIVTTNVGGIKHVLDPDDAVFVEVMNVKDIADGIMSVIEGSQRIDYENVERKMVDKFSKESVAKILKGIYASAISG